MGIRKKESVKVSYSVSFEEVLQFVQSVNLFDEVSLTRINAKKNSFPKNSHPLENILSCNPKLIKNPVKDLTIEEFTQWYAEKNGIEYLKIDPIKINMESVVRVISYAYASRLQILPINVDQTTVTVATCQPTSLDWITDLERAIKKEVKLVISSPVQIRNLLEEIFVIQKTFKSFGKKRSYEERQLIKEGRLDELNELLERAQHSSSFSSDGATVQIVNWLLNFADMERASDVHLEPKRGLCHIRFRIDGKLQTVYKMESDALQMLITRFKIVAGLKIDEKRLPQDGQLKHYIRDDKKVELRLSTIPCKYGEKMVIRIFNKNVSDLNLDFIGFTDKDRQTWEDLINETQGLVLVTGPTGSGKSTTLYSSLTKIASEDINVSTAEDPIEMAVDSLNQVQVNPQIGLDFAACMRSFLRQDPDVIMVGEIRDKDTGEMAIQASLTGHLVFSTVHTNGAMPTIQRLLELGIPSYLVNSSVSGILAQRLVRKLCPHCKEKVPTNKDLWNSLLGGNDYHVPEFTHEARGCDECKHTGFMGRFCIYELVKFNDHIRKSIKPDVEVVELMELTKGHFTPIRVNAAKKVEEGLTSIEEVLKVVY